MEKPSFRLGVLWSRFLGVRSPKTASSRACGLGVLPRKRPNPYVPPDLDSPEKLGS